MHSLNTGEKVLRGDQCLKSGSAEMTLNPFRKGHLIKGSLQDNWPFVGKENSNSNQQFTSTAKRRLKEIPRRCALPHKQQPLILKMHPSTRLWEHLR